MEAIHHPVMVEQVLEALAPRPGGVYVDATVGLGGHALALLVATPEARLIGLDVDGEALAVAGRRLAPVAERVTLHRASYWELHELLLREGVEAVDGVLFDLGVSSLQLDSPARGFSFRVDAALDMRFSGDGTSAADVLATAREEELVRILREFGEEPRARRVARAIAHARLRSPLRTTGDLARALRPVLGHRRGRVDPLTRTFQALRIATNRELDGIPAALEDATRALRPEGRLAVIAFHSLEDRLVKRTFRHLAGRCVCPAGIPFCACNPEHQLDILTPRPLRPSADEVSANPRARSARLRIAARSAP